MALLVAGEHTVVQAGQHHADVLDVDDGIEVAQGGRRPDVRVEPVGHAQAGRHGLLRGPARVVAVDGQRPLGDHAAGVATGEPVDDVEVVGALLQQQTCGVRPLGVPVLEVEVAAVADEVAAPHRAHAADRPVVDQLAHPPQHGKVTEVVAHVEPGAGAERGLEQRVAVGDGDGQRLLHEHRNARGEEEQRGPGVQMVGGEYEHGVQLVVEHLLVPVVHHHVGAEQPPGVLLAPRVRVGAGHDPGGAGPVHQRGHVRALSDADHADAQVRSRYLVTGAHWAVPSFHQVAGMPPPGRPGGARCAPGFPPGRRGSRGSCPEASRWPRSQLLSVPPKSQGRRPTAAGGAGLDRGSVPVGRDRPAGASLQGQRSDDRAHRGSSGRRQPGRRACPARLTPASVRAVLLARERGIRVPYVMHT